jgi:hypothetical protein
MFMRVLLLLLLFIFLLLMSLSCVNAPQNEFHVLVVQIGLERTDDVKRLLARLDYLTIHLLSVLG